MNTHYDRIRVEATGLARRDLWARHVEAWMRLKSPDLGTLTIAEFRTEVALAIRCADAAGPDASEALARCFGLPPDSECSAFSAKHAVAPATVDQARGA